MKYWIKNRFLYGLICSLVVGVLLGIAFIGSINHKTSHANEDVSIYKYSQIDFDVPSPATEQIAELKSKDFVSEIFPYYFSKLTVSYGSKSRSQTNVLFCKTFDEAGFTMYNGDRLLKSDDSLTNPIYVDFQFTSDTGVDLGDELSITTKNGTYKMKVARVYETNTYYGNGAIIIDLSKNATSMIDSTASFSGAYIKSSNYDTAKGYFSYQYKPMGRFVPKMEDETDEEYQHRYETFVSTSYANEITDFQSKRVSALSTYDSQMKSVSLLKTISCIIAVVAIVAYNIALSLRKSEKKYFLRLQDKKSISHYYILSAIIEALIAAVVVMICYFVDVLAILKTPAMQMIGWPFVVIACMIVAYVISFIISITTAKKAHK